MDLNKAFDTFFAPRDKKKLRERRNAEKEYKKIIKEKDRKPSICIVSETYDPVSVISRTLGDCNYNNCKLYNNPNLTYCTHNTKISSDKLQQILLKATESVKSDGYSLSINFCNKIIIKNSDNYLYLECLPTMNVARAVKEIAKIFNEADADRDSHINMHEMSNIFKKTGLDVPETVSQSLISQYGVPAPIKMTSYATQSNDLVVSFETFLKINLKLKNIIQTCKTKDTHQIGSWTLQLEECIFELPCL